MDIAIYGYVPTHTDREALAKLLCLLANGNDTRLLVYPPFMDTLCSSGISDIIPKGKAVKADTPDGAITALSIGGDGTFLRTAQWVGARQIPILGVNTGHLGYMSATTLQNPEKLATDILNGGFNVKRRSLLEVGLEGGTLPESLWPYALNEAAMLKEDTASMIACDTYVDGHPLANYLGDGLIISTPTGSTAYNLSAGGPIIQPSAPVWAISPIAPHALTMRPLVVSDRSVISVTAGSRSGSFRLSLDGNSITVASGVTVRISKAPFNILVASDSSNNWSDNLRRKLMWGIDPR